MKKLLGTLSFLLVSVLAIAQGTVHGLVTDASGKPLGSASLTVQPATGKPRRALTGADGSFSITGLPAGACTITVEYIGMKTYQAILETTGAGALRIALEPSDFYLNPLEVRAVRATDRSPFTKTDITRKQLEKLNLGQDIPFLLNQTPSVVVTSDAGNGVGYTGMRIRGSDATRVNVTLNGIPYNDAESHATYFVDLPDFASSVNSIQVQRGVGTSTNGAGAFGATVNISTNEFRETAYAEANNSYGSFNTWKNTVKVGSGLINDHFTIDARLSRITSDGYIDRATSNMQAFYLSGAYMGKTNSLRLNVFSGKQKTYQAWYGVSQALLPTNRTHNPAGMEKPGEPYDNQTDNYQQDHYQLFYNQAINARWSMNIATYLTLGNGYYEEYKAGEAFADYGLSNPVINGDTIATTDLVRQRWLDNAFYGQVFSVQYKHGADEITLGGNWSVYDGKHFGDVIWAGIGIPKDYRYYDYPAKKTDQNIYAKWLRQLNTGWNVFGDLQYRHVRHTMEGFQGNPDLFVERNFDFINPKAGISYHANGLHGYLSYALAHREPNRDDFEAAQQEQPVPEVLHDVELGLSKTTPAYNWGVTFYYMGYTNQLVLTGKINDVGSYTRTNVPNSYRMGVELQGGAVLSKWLNITANATFSRNKISSFTEYVDDYDTYKQQEFRHSNTDIAFSPAVIAGATVNITPWKNLEFSLLNKYVSRQFMDNTQDEQRMLQGYFTQDARLTFTKANLLFKEWNIIFQVNNLFNALYEPNGYTYPYFYGGELINDNYYYPMAGTNVMVALNIRF